MAPKTSLSNLTCNQPDNHLVFKIWVSIGRIFSGWLKDWMFSASRTIADIRLIRFCSVLQCFLATLSLSYVLRRLQKSGLAFSDGLVYCTVAFFAASLSSLVLIGWAVCTDFFIPTIFSLFAGLFLYESLMKVGLPEEGRQTVSFAGRAWASIHWIVFPFSFLSL